MGIISWTAARAAGGMARVYHEVSEALAKERRMRMTDGAAWSDVFGKSGAAGKSVTIDTAMKLSSFNAAVRTTASALAMLPLPVYVRQRDGSRVNDAEHPLAAIIGVSPNEDQTALEYWESVVAWMMTTGNACSEISRGYGDRINALSLLPGCVPDRDKNGELVFRYYDRGKRETLPRDKVFHVKGFGFGGDSGMSVIRYGVESISTALAAVEVSGKLFSNGMQASGLLTSDQVLNEKQRPQLEKIMQTYTGSEKAGKLMILEAGLKYERLQLSPVDSQLLEQQRFSIEDICRWCGIPPIVIGHSPQGQTMWGTGVEQIMIAWLTLGINPIAGRIERRIRKQLIKPGEQGRVYAEFNREAMLQMDSAAKAAFLSSMTQNGMMTRNEGRSKLNLPHSDQPAADLLTAQTNLAPLDALGGNGSGDQQARSALQAWLGIKEESKNEPTRTA